MLTCLIMPPLIALTHIAATDSVQPTSHYSIGAAANMSSLLGRKDYDVSLVKKHQTTYYSLFFDYQAKPADSSKWDKLYAYPHIEGGIIVADFHRVMLSRDDPTIPYYSRMGYVVTPYAAFRRDIVNTQHWAMGYTLAMGLGISTRPYNPHNNADNEFIGSRFSMYIGLDAYLTHHLSPTTDIGLGLEFKHYSNGALDRPNKGANTVGVGLRVSHALNSESSTQSGGLSTQSGGSSTQSCGSSTQSGGSSPRSPSFFYLDLSASVGAKALLDEWIYNFYYLSPDHPDYRTHHFALRTAWGVSVAPMWRYSMKYASGIGIDYTYATYSDRLREIDLLRHAYGYSYSPHILGLSLRHEAFYKRMSIAMSVGAYLHRKMGYMGKADEKPYYETVGLRWRPTFLNHGTYIGFNVKAHLLKADYMELRIGTNIRF